MSYLELTQENIAMLLTRNDKLPKYANGGYPLAYYTAIGEILCAHCALESLIAGEYTGECDEEHACWVEPYYEGPTEICINCNTEIESAYGDPDAEVES